MINPIHFQLTRITCYPISSGQNNRAPLVMLTSTLLGESLLRRKLENLLRPFTDIVVDEMFLVFTSIRYVF